MSKNVFEINGKRYMNPKSAADCWGLSTQAVTTACRQGRVVGAEKDSSNKWIIPIDAHKPLSSDEIRSLLILILALKNRPNLVIAQQSNADIIIVLDYLFDIKCIEAFDHTDKNIPHSVVLTEKGFKIATEGKALDLSFIDAGATFIQVVASVITIIQTVV